MPTPSAEVERRRRERGWRTVTLRIKTEAREALETLASLEGVSISQIVAVLAMAALKKKRPPTPK